jgi:hypothetical protein
MNSQQNAYFERWVRVEQIIYWLIALVMIVVSVLAFINYQAPTSNQAVESTVGTLVIAESPAVNNFLLFLFALPAVAGLYILYWTSNRDHVRALTTSVIHQNIMRLRVMGMALVAVALLMFFTPSNALQNIIVAPTALVFGLFSVYRSFKLAGFRALGGLNE